MPCTLPPNSLLADVSPSVGLTIALPTANTSRLPNPTPARMASTRCPLIVSTSESAVSTHQHQHEQEQHQDRAGVDDDLDDEEERRVLGGVLHREEIITVARHNAECPGLRARIIPSAPKIITGASSQKATAAPVTMGITTMIIIPYPRACAC